MSVFYVRHVGKGLKWKEGNILGGLVEAKNILKVNVIQRSYRSKIGMVRVRNVMRNPTQSKKH